MEQALAFVRLRIDQVDTDLQVYKELGATYAEEQTKLTAVLSELNNLAMSLEVFITVNNNANTNKHRKV